MTNSPEDPTQKIPESDEAGAAAPGEQRPPPPSQVAPPQQPPATRFSDRLFSLRALLGVAAGGLVLGGLAGGAAGSVFGFLVGDHAGFGDQQMHIQGPGEDFRAPDQLPTPPAPSDGSSNSSDSDDSSG